TGLHALDAGLIPSWQRETSTAVSPPSGPKADAGGPYSIAEGSDVVVDAGGSTPGTGAITGYDWDLNGDGVYDDASGVHATFTGRNDGVFAVSVRVTSSSGQTATGNANVTVQNVAPRITGPVASMDAAGLATLTA